MSQRPSIGSSSTLPPDAGEVGDGAEVVGVDVEPGAGVPVDPGVRVGVEVDVGVALAVGKVAVGSTDEGSVGVCSGESWTITEASLGTEGAAGRTASSSKPTSVIAIGEERREGQVAGVPPQPVSLHGARTRYTPKVASPEPDMLSTYTYSVARLTSVPSGSALIGKWR
jgi:hypothetical protein